MDAAHFSYGSDTSGLVWGFLFDGEGSPVSNMDTATAADWVRTQDKSRPGEFIWLHFNLSNAACEKWLAGHLQLADEFYEALHRGSRSTRIEVANNTLIGVVNDVPHDFSFDASEMSTLWISVTQNIVISARRTPLQSIERLRQEILQGGAVKTSVDLLIHLLRGQADVLVRIVRDAVERVDGVEDKLLAGRLAAKREDLGTMRRVLVRLQRLLAPEPASLFRLLQRPPDWMSDTDTQEFRQATEEFAVVLSDISSLKERIKLLQEELAARVDEENGRSLFVLTIVTVLALPINIVAGLLGMNVGGIPLAQHPDGFWVVLAVVTCVTIAAAWIVRRLQMRR